MSSSAPSSVWRWPQPPSSSGTSDAPSPILDPASINQATEPARVVGKITIYTERVIASHSSTAVTYLGRYQGRVAAIKRVPDGSSPWKTEIDDAIALDLHPNVLRLYGWEEDGDFILMAFELCPCSLRDLMTYTGGARDAISLREQLCSNSLRVMRQLVNALSFVHSQGFMHLNVRPSNVLLPRQMPGTEFRIAVSDFGALSRDPRAFPSDLTFSAPEILARALAAHALPSSSSSGNTPELPAVDSPSPPPDITASLGVTGTAGTDLADLSPIMSSSSSPPRNGPIPHSSLATEPLSSAADVFSAGCVLYFFLTSGLHPFLGTTCKPNDPQAIKAILENRPPILDKLDPFMCGGSAEEARKLVKWMLKRWPKQRPPAAIVVHHPFFWSPAVRLEFLRAAADRIKVEPLDSEIILKLEREAPYVIGVPGGDWLQQLDPLLQDQLTKVSKYDPTMLRDLLKAIRNVKNHVTEFAEPLRKLFEVEGVQGYFCSRFPKLLMSVFKVVYKETDMGREPGFRIFLEKDEL